MPRLARLPALLIACWALGALPAAAAPLGLTLADYSDIVAGFIDVSWDAGAGELNASGFAFELDGTGSLNTAISGGTFALTASLDASGNLLGGMLTIGGTIASLGYSSGTLLTGALVDFGFRSGGGDPLEFVVAVNGGDAAPLYLARNPLAGVILTGTGFGGSFAVDFDNLVGGIAGTGAAVADVASIPLPAALWLLMPALLALGTLRRR